MRKKLASTKRGGVGRERMRTGNVGERMVLEANLDSVRENNLAIK